MVLSIKLCSVGSLSRLLGCGRSDSFPFHSPNSAHPNLEDAVGYVEHRAGLAEEGQVEVVGPRVEDVPGRAKFNRNNFGLSFGRDCSGYGSGSYVSVTGYKILTSYVTG